MGPPFHLPTELHKDSDFSQNPTPFIANPISPFCPHTPTQKKKKGKDETQAILILSPHRPRNKNNERIPTHAPQIAALFLFIFKWILKCNE